MTSKQSDRIYLDYAAATPVDQRVIAAMQPFWTDQFYNPSALYAGARAIKSALDDAHATVAQLIGSRPSEIIFTAGGTESANLAIHGVMQLFPDGEILTSSIEHEAVLYPARNYNHTTIPVNKQGIVDVEQARSLINDKTVLISVMLVNNEIGSVQPIRDIVEIAKNIRNERTKNGNKMPLYVHTDACQAPMYMDCNVARLGVDMMTLNGGKMHGPKQSGILYKQAQVKIQPQIQGGGQQWGLRSGTENVAFAAGFAKALELAAKGRAKRASDTAALRDWFMQSVESRFDCSITGHRKHRIANNVHIQFKDADNERILYALDDMGVDAAAGSACSASKDTSSHVLIAMGYSDEEAHSSVRMTIGSETTKSDLERTLEALAIAIKA